LSTAAAFTQTTATEERSFVINIYSDLHFGVNRCIPLVTH